MSTRTLSRLACLALVSAVAVAARPAEPPREMHGSADAYAAPGVALAWGVLRGAADGDATAILRIVADPTTYRFVAVTGRDPFTQRVQTLQRAMASTDGVEMRVPRAQFAEFPRTEVSFYDSEARVASGTPQLVVFYLGIPDTTPEFTSEPALERYLAERIARLRDGGGKAR